MNMNRGCEPEVMHSCARGSLISNRLESKGVMNFRLGTVFSQDEILDVRNNSSTRFCLLVS